MKNVLAIFNVKKCLYPYCSALEAWEKTPQLGFEPVYYKEGMFYINGPTWTKQCAEY